MTPEIFITRPLPDSVVTEALTRFSLTIREDTGPLTEAACIEALHRYDGILPTLGDPFNAAVFAGARAPRCQILANFGVGYNHIDVAAAHAAGVRVTNTPGAVTEATADIGMMLILMTARRAAEGERLARSGNWTGWHPTQMLGQGVSGRSLGIVGMGRIGQAVARRAHLGFGMEVRFFNRSRLGAGVIGTQGTLEEALGCDFVLLAVPATQETKAMIGAEALARMQPHAILVNISRGDVVDETALVDALQAGRIGGAGLDVYEREPFIPDALRALDTVTLLPHLGTAIVEVREAMGLMAVANLKAHFDGGDLPNPV